jgi:hypothetical protein
MQVHHKIEFDQFIDKLFYDGAASLRWDRLYLWFGAKRIAKRTYQTFHDAWSTLSLSKYPNSPVPAIWIMKLDNSFTIVREGYKEEEVWMLTEDGESSYKRR